MSRPSSACRIGTAGRSGSRKAAAAVITLAVERSEAPRLLVLRIADPDLPFGGTWTYEISPAAHGSTLTITEDGAIYNLLFRVMARFVFGYESTMAAYLTAAEGRLASQKSSR